MKKSPRNPILSIAVLAGSGIFVFFVLATLTLLPYHALAQDRSISISNNDQITSMIQEANAAAGSFTALRPDHNRTGALAPSTTHPAFFTGEIALGSDWYYLQFANGTPFGYYRYLVFMNDPNYFYHIDMGFEYFFDANNNGGIYFYDFASNGFFYTSPSPSFPFPFLYDFSLNTALYYFPDPNRPGRYTSNPRYFYNFATHQVITK